MASNMINMSMNEWEQVQNQIIKLRNDNYELEQKKQKELSVLRDKLAKREEELVLLKEMVASTSTHQEELIALKKENQSLLKSLQHLNEITPPLLRTSSEKPKDSAQHRVDTLLKEIEEWKEKEKQHQKNLKIKDDKIAKLEAEKIQLREDGDKVIEKFSEIMLSNDKAKDEIKSLEERLRKQQEGFGVMIQEHQKRIQTENDKQQEIIEGFKTKCKNLENELSTQKETNAHLVSELDSVKEINQLQSSQIESLKVSISKFSEEGATENKKLQELIKNNNTFKRKIADKDREIEDLQTRNNELQIDIKELQEMKNKYEILLAQHELINEKYSKLTERYEALNLKFTDSEKMKDEKEKENTTIKNQFENLKKEKDIVDKRIVELESIVEKSNESINIKTQEIEQIRSQLSEIPELRKQLQETSKALKDEIKAHADAKKKIQDNEMERLVLQRQNATVFRKLQDQVRSLQGVPVVSDLVYSTASPTTNDHGRSRTRLTEQGRTNSTRDKIQSSNKASKEEIPKEDKEDKKANPEENLILENDVLVMGLKLGMLQQENFELEQQNQTLRAELKQLKDESDKKSRVIAKQLRGVKKKDNFWDIDSSKTSGAPLAFVGSFFNSTNETPLQEEKHNKMEAVLEETLLQNMQLQDDIRNIATELEKLTLENKTLKQQLQTPPKH